MPVFNEVNYKKLQPSVSTLAGSVKLTKSYRVVNGVKVTDSTWPGGGGGNPDPDPEVNAVTGFFRTTKKDIIDEKRWRGELTYPGTLESKADVVTQKNAFKNNPNSKIYDYAGPHILSPGDSVLVDLDTQPSAWSSGTAYGNNARVRYNGYVYRQFQSGGAPAGTLPTNTSYWRRTANIINGTPINSTVPQATDTFQGELNEAAKKRIAAAALWCRMEKNNTSVTVQAERQTVGNLVKSKIQGIMNRPGMDFSNSARWNNSVDADAPPQYDMAVMLQVFFIAYEDTAEFWPTAERNAFMLQLFNAAKFYDNMDEAYLGELYNSPSPRNGNVSTYSVNATRATGSGSFRFRTKPPAYSIHKTHNNRNACNFLLLACIGHAQKHPDLYGTFPAYKNFLDTSCAIYYKENVAYAFFADGSDGEHERNENDKPSQGLQYAVIRRGVLSWIEIIDAFNGGNLWEFTTSVGYLGSEDATNANPKSHLKCALFDIKLMTGEVILYGSDNSSHTSDLFYSDYDGQVNLSTMSKIKWEGAQNNFDYLPNILWNNTKVKEAQVRDVSKGFRPYTTSMKGAGGYPWWWGMFGNTPALDLLYLGLEDYKDDIILS